MKRPPNDDSLKQRKILEEVHAAAREKLSKRELLGYDAGTWSAYFQMATGNGESCPNGSLRETVSGDDVVAVLCDLVELRKLTPEQAQRIIKLLVEDRDPLPPTENIKSSLPPSRSVPKVS